MLHLRQQIAVPSDVLDAGLCWQPWIASVGFDMSKPPHGLPPCWPHCHHRPCRGCRMHFAGTDGGGISVMACDGCCCIEALLERLLDNGLQGNPHLGGRQEPVPLLKRPLVEASCEE